MSNIFSKIAQLFSSNKEGQRPQSPEAQTSASQATTSQSVASCSRPAINLTHIDLPTAPSFGTRSLEEVRTAAEAGDAEAQYLLFDYYASGHREESDRPAFEWLTKAAERGFSDAYLQLYHLYRDGKGIEANEDTAINYLRKAMEAGSGTAYLIVAKGFLPGNGGGPIDYDAAYYYAEQAAHLGSSQAVELIIHLLEENLASGDHTELLRYWRRQLRPTH